MDQRIPSAKASTYIVQEAVFMTDIIKEVRSSLDQGRGDLLQASAWCVPQCTVSRFCTGKREGEIEREGRREGARFLSYREKESRVFVGMQRTWAYPALCLPSYSAGPRPTCSPRAKREALN